MSEIALDPSWVGPMGENIRDVGRQMPDPPGRGATGSGSDEVDDALTDMLDAVGDHLLGLGAGAVRLGQSATDATEAFLATDAAAGGER
ncbi:MAG TPA: hypothetical protein VGC67_06225 [Cellulomonas sp.]